jgi:tRNA pseudouridine55 synthase
MGLRSGIINLDKPDGITSALAVTRVKWMLPRRLKIGHAGTLDPFATGVLLLLIGKSTKLCQDLMDAPKQYEATIKFGFITATDDPESPEQPFAPAVEPKTREDLLRLLARFTGEIQQKPPIFSALKVAGERACDRIRKGQQIELTPRNVMVYGLELLDFHWPAARLRIDCGRGTYIRSLARDLGIALNVGGYLTELRRTKVGEFDVDNACTLEQLTNDGVEKYAIDAVIR